MPAPRHILGLSAYYHDAAAALVVDGRIVAAAQEERFSRRKNDPDFPAQAVEFCLRQAGLNAGQLDTVVFYDKPVLKFARLLETYLAVAPGGWRTFPTVLTNWLGGKLDLRKTIRGQLPGLAPACPILFTEHHQAHAASAFYPSPFAEAAILTIDGVGEWATTTLGHGRGREIKLLKELRFPHSLGLVYSAFTDYCGFRINSGEYKLMGLAPYGEPFDPMLLDAVKRTDGLARETMFAAALAGWNADQLRIVETSDRPIAVVSGADEPFVDNTHLQGLGWANLWDNRVHILGGLGHAPFWQAPERFDPLLERFLADLFP